ncbi:MOSC domain-containing protein, partial [Salipiger aestuarii]|uniref:MOSC domain-containing protein n=1 Tax=Salipiger aestuarii TaxID=568098 RepID=UPI0035CC7D8C
MSVSFFVNLIGDAMSEARVVAVAKDGVHRFSKEIVSEIRIIEGMGVEGDAHLGKTVKHRSRVAVDPTQPNLRQVHLIHSELFSEVSEKGFIVRAADLGENITTFGVDLLALPRGTVLKIGQTVELEVTGLRNPCK